MWGGLYLNCKHTVAAKRGTMKQSSKDASRKEIFYKHNILLRSKEQNKTKIDLTNKNIPNIIKHVIKRLSLKRTFLITSVLNHSENINVH